MINQIVEVQNRRMTQDDVDLCLSMYLDRLDKIGLPVTYGEIEAFRGIVTDKAITMACLRIEK